MNQPDVPQSQGRHSGGHPGQGPGIAGAGGPPMLEQSSLEQVIARFGPMSPQQTAVVGLAVLDQLVTMHRQGMLHGDVRPSSVLLGPYEQIVLAGPSLPSSLFTSPEGVTSPAADLWSLGATLYTAVEGRPPTPGGSLNGAGPIAPVLFHLLAGDPAQRPDPDTLRKALLDIIWYRPEPPSGAPFQVPGSPVADASAPPPSGPVAFGQAPQPVPQGHDAAAPLGDPGASGTAGVSDGWEGRAVPVTEAEVTAPFRKNLAEQMSAITSGVTPQDAPAPLPNTPTAWQPPPFVPLRQDAPAQNSPQQDAPTQGPPRQDAPAQSLPQQDVPAQSPTRQDIPSQGLPQQDVPTQSPTRQDAPAQSPTLPGPPFQGGPPPPQDAPATREVTPLPLREGTDEPTVRSTQGTGILVPRPIVALTGVLLFGMAVSIGILLTSVLANSDGDVSAEPAGAEGRFATAPRACSLLDDDQVNQLVPSFKSSEVEHSACDWLNSHDWRKPNVEKYDMRVRLTAQKQDGSGVTRAKEYLAGKKKDFADKSQLATPKPAPPKDLRGVGEEAFSYGAYNSINLYGGSYKVTLVFRVSNLIAEVTYERGGVTGDPDGKIAAGAVQAARWLTESLKTDG